MMNLENSINSIKGIGEKSVALYKKLNIETLKDLIFYIPKGFDLFEACTIPDLNSKDQLISISGYFLINTFTGVKKGHLSYNHVYFLSNNEKIKLTFFNMPYLKKQIHQDEEYVIRGILQVSKNSNYSFVQPQIYTLSQYRELEGTLCPLYPLTKGLTNNAIRKAIKQIINNVTGLNDGLDELYTTGTSFGEALKNMHFPTNLENFMQARERIVFHEFVSFILQMKTYDNITRNMPFTNPLFEVAETHRLIEELPYRLTNAQQKVWNQISNDLSSNVCMNRLVQGDVGSGKTILAFLSLLMNACNNHQGVLMAPTEVLAKQHYENLTKLIDKYKLPLKPVLLLGSMRQKSKQEIYNLIKNGACNVIIGTHAVFQDKVVYNDLTLVITDEQHRFGVKQREAIVNKGKQVHLLVMSATPIPRSLAMILYGDISISILDELPSNRLPIKNCVVNKDYRKKAYEFIEKEVKLQHQAYVICPAVEEGVDESLENVVDYCQKLSAVLPANIIVSYLHGKMTLEKKNEIMEAFADKKIDVLVSTTVIEVGIDVPNATVIMIENADRFGLAQLHQLRGRVGRGDAQSYCIFINSKENEHTKERLEILNKSNNGFHIADEDLRLRGPGDIFGIRQSGEFGFAIGDIYNDSLILKKASECVDYLMQKDNEGQYKEVSNRLMETSFNLVDFRTI